MKATVRIATQDEVNRYFDYKDGKLYWKERTAPMSRVKIGDEAGWSHHKRYKCVVFKGRNYQVHRLIWLYVYGVMPTEIDHINHDRADNRIENLREVTRRENNMNRSQRSDNTSGVTGISWHKNTNKWVLQVSTPDRRVRMVFSNKDDAIKKRAILAAELNYHPNHGAIS